MRTRCSAHFSEMTMTLRHWLGGDAGLRNQTSTYRIAAMPTLIITRLWQPWRVVRRLPVIVFALAFVGLVLDAGGGAGWGEASARAVLAVQQRHLAASPLYD